MKISFHVNSVLDITMIVKIIDVTDSLVLLL